MKKIVLLVTILMALSVTAYSAEKYELKPIEVTEFVLNNSVTLKQLPDGLSSDEDYGKMYSGIKNYDGIIEFKFDMPANANLVDLYFDQYATKLGNMYFDILFENPELMQCVTSYIVNGEYYFSDDGDSIIFTIYFRPTYIIEPTNKQVSSDEERDVFLKREIPPLVKKALLYADSVVADAITENMTDEEKALVLHDYIIDHTTYNTLYASTVGSPSTNEHWQNHTAFGVFYNHEAVCQGYALAYNLLLTRAGIPNKYVMGTANGGGHAWSVVKLGDNWYHVDSTHDDPTNADCIGHSHFLVSDAQIYALGHTQWTTDVICNSTKYSGINYCFHDVNPTEETIHYNDGYFYAYRHLHVDKNTWELLPEYNYNKRYTDGVYRDSDTGAYFVYEYVKSNFDGSDFEIITEEEYRKSFVNHEKPKINSIYVAEDGKAHDLTIDNVAQGKVFVRMTGDTIPLVYIAFYGENNKLVKMAKAELMDENSVEISNFVPNDEYEKVSVFVWEDGLLTPITENLVIE